MALPQRYIENVEKDAYTEDEYFEFERRARKARKSSPFKGEMDSASPFRRR